MLVQKHCFALGLGLRLGVKELLAKNLFSVKHVFEQVH